MPAGPTHPSGPPVDNNPGNDSAIGPPASGPIVLQTICASPAHPELHHRPVTGDVAVDDGALRLAAGSRVSFDAYFSSFFCSHWTTHTTVASLAAVVDGHGRFHVEVHRGGPGRPAVEVAHHRVESDHEVSTTIAIPTVDGGLGDGRIWVELVAETAAVITGVVFVTTDQPAREVVLSAGVVTHSRPEAMRPLIEQLRTAAAAGALDQVVVVNQGPPLAPELAAFLVGDGDLVTVIEQANLGGSGGFARTMLESLASGRASHHVLVEDDAIIDHEVIARSRAFLRFARSDVVLGGQMLDLVHRTRLSHSGMRYHPDDRVEFLDYGLDVDDRAGLDRLTDVTAVDFNGWWFCVLPTALLADRGLPLPFFVENDDVELGLRLATAGVPTVMLAGLGVWHEPFWAKPTGWKAYYNTRNQALLAVVHPDRAAAKSPTLQAWRVLRYVAQHDYRRAAWMLDALDDFAAGPEPFAAEGIEDVHRRVVRAADRYRADAVSQEQLDALAPVTVRPPARTALRAGLLLVGRLAAALIAPGRDVQQAVRVTNEWERTPQNLDRRPWVLAYTEADQYVIHYAQRRALLGLIARTVVVTGRLWRRRRTASARWRTFLRAASTPDAWRTILASQRNERCES